MKIISPMKVNIKHIVILLYLPAVVGVNEGVYSPFPIYTFLSTSEDGIAGMQVFQLIGLKTKITGLASNTH